MYFKVEIQHGLLQICPILWLHPSLVCYQMVVDSYVSWEGLSFLSVEAKKGKPGVACLKKKKKTTQRMKRIESERELGRACCEMALVVNIINMVGEYTGDGLV